MTPLIEVKHADGVKCPRCWHYHTVIGNPQDVCDRCLLLVNAGLNELDVPPEEVEEWRRAVQAMLSRWRKP
jgi:hypothetical protein